MSLHAKNKLSSYLPACGCGWLRQDISNKSYRFEPASVPMPDSALRGEVLTFTFSHSVIYPGTTRTYWIYIPAAYKPETPACLYVAMDGISFNTPTVFDYLIAKKEMPITIGVFVQAGKIMILSFC